MGSLLAPKPGLPCIVILDSAGKHLTTNNTAELEDGDYRSSAGVMCPREFGTKILNFGAGSDFWVHMPMPREVDRLWCRRVYIQR